MDPQAGAPGRLSDDAILGGPGSTQDIPRRPGVRWSSVQPQDLHVLPSRNIEGTLSHPLELDLGTPKPTGP